MNLVTFLLIVAILGSIVGALVKGTARTVSLITALLAFVLLVGTPNPQGNASNFFANLFRGNNTSTSQGFDTANGNGTTGGIQGGNGVTPTQTGGTGTGNTGTGSTSGSSQGQAGSSGDLSSSPRPSITGDNGRSGNSPATSYPSSRTSQSGTRTFPSGYTSGGNTRRPRALW